MAKGKDEPSKQTKNQNRTIRARALSTSRKRRAVKKDI